jgi:hypothetical protein
VRKSTIVASDAESWLVRLPDGRVLRARSTEALRRYLKTGGIPWDSRVRRSPEAPWQTLDDVDAFADLAPRDGAPKTANAVVDKVDQEPNGNAANTADMRTLGMRGLVDELMNAADSCLHANKLTAAAFTGLGIGIALLARAVTLPLVSEDWHWGVNLATVTIVGVLFSLCTSVLAQLTALELSRFRPAQFHEIRPGLLIYAFKQFVSLALIGGVLGAIVLLLRWLPEVLPAANPPDTNIWLDALLHIINGARRAVEALCWPIFGLAMLLMGPILVVEEASILRGLREWLAMLRRHLGRIYLYQAVAFAFAAVMTLPLLVPVLLAFGTTPETLSLGESVAFHLLMGVSLTPMLAYLLVAHVFVYLNLRYEFFYSMRER